MSLDCECKICGFGETDSRRERCFGKITDIYHSPLMCEPCRFGCHPKLRGFELAMMRVKRMISGRQGAAPTREVSRAMKKLNEDLSKRSRKICEKGWASE